MTQSISASVGRNGVNRKDDSKFVQESLNNVDPEDGGPQTPLVVDGLPWQRTIQAINRFQRDYVGFRWPDGRVDPNGKTLNALNEYDDNIVGEPVHPTPVYLV